MLELFDVLDQRDCCDGWGEVRDGQHLVACPTCCPDAYQRAADA